MQNCKSSLWFLINNLGSDIVCFPDLVFLCLFINMSERVFLLLKFSFPQDGFTHKCGKKKVGLIG